VSRVSSLPEAILSGDGAHRSGHDSGDAANPAVGAARRGLIRDLPSTGPTGRARRDPLNAAYPPESSLSARLALMIASMASPPNRALGDAGIPLSYH
jgi:hypothetical protein